MSLTLSVYGGFQFGAFLVLSALHRELQSVLKVAMCRPPTHHAGAGGNTKNAWSPCSARNPSSACAECGAHDTRVASSACVACLLLLERHSVHVGLAQLEAGALVEAVRGLA